MGSANTIPDWFWEAVETPAETRSVEVDECDVVYRFYPNPGKRGMLLIHGMHAHSHWWDFIAPQLLDEYEIAAMDLTGMGDSDYRYEYNANLYAEEIKAVLDDAGFDNQCFVVAHSFGGYMAVRAANQYPDRFAALILIDSGIRSPEDPPPDHSMMNVRAKVYPDKENALMRFRLQPPQSCENEYILQYIARNSLMPVEGGGYAWKFDEDFYTAMKDIERQPEDYQNLTVKLGLIYGEDSELFSLNTLAYMRELVPQDFPAVGIEKAQHHVFLDQPLAFVETLRDMCKQLS
ncbi:yugF [Symbiodinium necroappetens]|uniref:YugF protein n=1 Tax=Symbiodinium necroappetens TaxID=1628268 RepID=A0A812ISZ1_9DINO|nr:yugF [Symbiodinium necroappetens]